MTERGIYYQFIPIIAEMAAECLKLNPEADEEWKTEVLDNASESAKGFVEKVLIIIDDVRKKRDEEKCFIQDCQMMN